MTAFNSEQVRSIFDRWSRLEDEKQATSEDLKGLFAEAKSRGFNTKAMRAAFRVKRKRDDKPEEFDELQDDLRTQMDLYLSALGGEIVEFPPMPTKRAWEDLRQSFKRLEDDGFIEGRDEKRFVYFIHAPRAGLIKIGSSGCVKRRVMGLACSSPVALYLLGVTDGGVKKELELHEEYKELRSHGEWFIATDQLLSDLRLICARDAHEPKSRAKAEEAVRSAEAQAKENLPRGEEGNRPADLTDDAASRLSDGRTSDATEVEGRDGSERRAPHSKATDAGPAPDFLIRKPQQVAA